MPGIVRLFALILAVQLAVAAPVDARAEPVVSVSGDDSSVPLVPRTSLLDPEGVLTPPEAVRRLTSPDASVDEVVRSRGYIADTMWARIVLDVAPEAAGRWYLSLELPNFDRVDVYLVPAEGAPERLLALGDRVPAPTDIRTRFHLAPIDLAPGRTVLLARGRTGSTMTLDLKLRKLDALLVQEQGFVVLQGFYLGIAVIFGLAALVLYAYTRQSIYLIYVVNLIGHSGLWLIINGTGPGVFWPELARSVHIDPTPLISVTFFGTTAFAASFLSTARVPKWVRQGLWGLTVFGLALTVFTLAMPREDIYWVHGLVSNIVLPSVGLLFVLTGIGLYRGEPAARPLMLTWFGLAAAVALALMRDIGIVPNNSFTLTGPQLGSIFEMAVFAYMLVDRLGRLQREKEQLQRDALTAAQEHEAVLEQRVADRTAELDAALERERNARRLQQQFVAMVSHEFRTPLAIIDGAAQNMAARDAQNVPRVGKIRGSVQRLLRMIDTCLVDERVEGGALQLQPRHFDLRELLDEAVDVFRASAPDRRIACEVPPEPVAVAADMRLIEIVLNNLLENAIRYSPAGTTVVAAVEESADWVEVSVADQGPGVPERDRVRIFDKYYRGGNSEGTAGAGLGLHLVRSILEAHDGTVRCEAGRERGSRFVVRLPREVPSARAVAE